MSNGVKYVFTFALGAAAGALVAWKVLDERYKRIMDEEVESFRAAISNKEKNEADKPETEEVEPEFTGDDRKNYATTLANCGYTSYSDAKDGLKDVDGTDDIHVITPIEFAENEDYDTHTLTYYSDGVLTDEQDNPVDDIDEVVGLESLEIFGMCDTDSVYVRNDRLKTDYEILLDMRPYSDVKGPSPHIAEAFDVQESDN